MNKQILLPRHVAIIMDGNGRWAKEKNLPRTLGHREGVKRVKEVVNAASKLGIEVLTLFAFSTENWNRPESEVNTLMRFLGHFLDKEIKELAKNNIKLKIIGRQYPLPGYLIQKLNEAQEKTKNNSGLVLILAINYGSRQEIADAVKKFTQEAILNKINLDELDDDFLKDYLYTSFVSDPDLLIRTSGEQRISNFLLWQISYTELYFTKKFWPDFDTNEFKKALRSYKTRQRRFGGF